MGALSIRLVKRWRRIAREWTQAGAKLKDCSPAERVDCRARADVFADCADSLERSLKIAARRRHPKEKP